MTPLAQFLNDDPLDVLLACRPVYTRSQDVAAFELLLQGESANKGATLKQIEASSPIILGNYNQVYQRGQTRSVPGFLKITDDVIFAPVLPDLPQQHYILEVGEDVLLTSERVERLRDMAKRGYRIALSSYDPDDSELDAMLDVVHIVKLDTSTMSQEQLQKAVARLRAHGVETLADNLENKERFAACMDMGFTYYQGDFLSTPEPIKGKKISGNKVLLLELLSELQNPAASPLRLEEIALRDARLTYRILKLVNSAAVSLHREVNSISHAIGLLGMKEIQRWASLFLIEGERGKPQELTRKMLVRGRMCEVLAEVSGNGSASDNFIVGLLSLLDAMMDISMPELMQQVPLNQQVKNALLHRDGNLGAILAEVELYESGRFSELKLIGSQPVYETAYRHSVAWARQAMQVISGEE
ncbi:EAL and HDOD domain-containing protein [Microbulbifer harenosus]|uniref:EAL and HDOD domain-containing protein n=1 Tax=Microbulbifer TaxID=48073 RepID=UPI001407E0F1|nr:MULTISPECIES: HDOD domain-containing protein [Microbulbifer]